MKKIVRKIENVGNDELINKATRILNLVTSKQKKLSLEYKW